MRPPLNAGENGNLPGSVPAWHQGFNEAPAECGGKPARSRDRLSREIVASMRPPLNAGKTLPVASAKETRRELQ